MVMDLRLVQIPQEEHRFCGACPRELTATQRRWCSEYCRQWNQRHPGEPQTVPRPLTAIRVRQKYTSGPGICQAGCGKATMPSKAGKDPRKWCSDSCRQWAQSHPGQQRSEARLTESQFRALNEAYEKINGETQMDLRERLGRLVRDCWIAWAREQFNLKTSWLTPWEQISPEEQEVDCRIGMTLYRLGQRERNPDGEA